MKKLKSKLSFLIVPLLALVLVGFFGCASFQDVVTPCSLDEESIESIISDVEDFKNIVFAPTSPIGMAVSALVAFVIGALGISKPKDKKKIAACCGEHL